MARTGLLVCFVFAVSAVPAFSRAAIPQFTPHDSLVLEIDENTSVDWTGGFVYASARVRLPRIVFDSSHPDFATPGTETSLSGARARARSEALELASIRLTRAITGLRLDGRFTVLERMQQDRSLRERLGNLSRLFRVKSRHTGEGYVSIELALPFREEEGLYSVLAGSHYNSQPVPEVGPLDVVDELSGLVLDVREQPDFVPSLEPRIYTDQGRLIYGPEVITRACTIRRGPAIYYTDEEKALKDPRVGMQTLYAYAAGVLGNGRSDLVLDASDAERLLASPVGRQSLHYCAVVFVVRK